VKIARQNHSKSMIPRRRGECRGYIAPLVSSDSTILLQRKKEEAREMSPDGSYLSNTTVFSAKIQDILAWFTF
jgi:hypothetical protein